MDLEVTNFQSIEHVSVTLSGLTVLVGRSNLGKSAIVRALDALLTNPTGSDFVRHGDKCARKVSGNKTCKCYSEVTLKLDGHTVTWQKGDSTHRYTVDGTLYDKVERGAPSFLVPLGLHPLGIGDDEVSLQVSSQWRPLFLLDRKGSEIAEAVSGIGNLDRIHDALRKVESDKRQAVSTKKVREADLQDVTSKLAKMDGLGDLEALVADVCILEKAYQASAKRLEWLRSIKGRFDRLSSEVARQEVLLASTLEAPPHEKANQSKKLASWVQRNERVSLRVARSEQALEGTFPSPLKLPLETLALLRKGQRLQRAEPPQCNLTPPVQPKLVPPGFTQRVASVATQAKKKKESLEAMGAELDRLSSELKATPLCPTCGRPCEVHS